MEDLSLNIPMKFLFDLPAWNAIIGQIKKSLGDTLGKNIKPIDEKAWRTAMNNAASASQKFTTEQKQAAAAVEQLGDEMAQTQQKSSTFKGVVGGVLAGAGISFGMGALIEGIKGVGGAMISGNQEMETYKTQLGTLMGSAGAAEERLAELAKFGAETPFELPELVRAEKVLIGFGLQGQKAFKLTGESATDLRTVVGDVAAGVGVPFEELALTVGKFSSGATGEAISRLQELGIVTREQLQDVGIQFSKSGELLSPLPEAMTATVKIMKEKFGGGMAALSQTAGGQMSTLSDNISSSLRSVGVGLFDTFKEAITGLNAALSSEGTQKAIQDVAKAAGEFVKVLVYIIKTLADLAPMLIALGAAYGILTITMNAGAIATAIVTKAQWLWNAALNANPIGLVVAAVAALVIGVKLLSDAMQETTAEKLDQNKADLEALQTTKKMVESKKTEKEQLLTLSTKYKELVAQKQKGRDVDKELKKVGDDINKIYPATINHTGLLSDNMGRLETVTGKAKKEIEGLSSRLITLNKDIKKTVIENLRLEAEQAAGQILMDSTGDFANASESLLKGVGILEETTKEGNARWLQTYKNQIYRSLNLLSAENTSAMIDQTVQKFKLQVLKSAGFTKAEKDATIKNFQVFADNYKKIAYALKNETAGLDKPEGTGTGGDDKKDEVKELKDFSEQIAKINRETEKVRNDIARQGIEDRKALDRQALADKLKEQEEELNADIDAAKKLKAGKDISASQQAELIQAINNKITALREQNAAELLKMEYKWAKEEVEANQKKADDLLKADLDLLKKRIELKEFEAGVSGGDNLIKILEEQSNTKIEILKREGEQKAAEYMKQDKDYQAALENLMDTQAKQATGQLTIYDVQKAQQQFDQVKANLLANSEIIRLINVDTQRNIDAEIRNLGTAIKEARINEITDLAERDRQISILTAQKKYDEDLKLAKDNEAMKLKARLDFLNAQQAADDAYFAKTNLAYKGILTLAEKFANIATTRSQALIADKDQLDKELADLEEAYRNGELTHEEFMEKINENQKAQAKNQEETNRAILTAGKEAMAETFASITGDIYTKFKTEGKATFEEIGVAFAATTAGFVLQGKSASKAITLAALQALKAMIPILTAEIFGITAASPANIATLGAWGFAAFAAITGTLYGLVSLAEAQVNAAQFAKGGLNPWGFGGMQGMTDPGMKHITINETGQPEFIFNARTTSKNLTDFVRMNQEDTTLEEHIRRNRPDILSEQVLRTDIRRKLDDSQKSLEVMERVHARERMQYEKSIGQLTEQVISLNEKVDEQNKILRHQKVEGTLELKQGKFEIDHESIRQSYEKAQISKLKRS